MAARASASQVPEATADAAAGGGEAAARRGSPKSEARAKRSPPQPGQLGRRSSAASVTTYSQSRHRNDPVPASVPDVIASIGSLPPGPAGRGDRSVDRDDSDEVNRSLSGTTCPTTAVAKRFLHRAGGD